MDRIFDPTRSASLLAEKWKTGEQIAAIPAQIRPSTLSEGYDVQDSLIGLLGLETAGWKLGVGSRGAKRESGVGRSIFGRLLQPRMYRPGAVVALPGDAPATIEFELAYVLGRDIAPGCAIVNVADVIGSACVTFEVVLSRFVDRRAVGWPSFAADNAAFGAMVVGEAVAPDEAAAIAESLSVRVDGVERARAAGGDDATDPIAALRDLIVIAGERNMPLPAGSIISTGAMSLPFNVAGAAVIEARYKGGRLGFSISRAA